jgi:hypothetical protein
MQPPSCFAIVLVTSVVVHGGCATRRLPPPDPSAVVSVRVALEGNEGANLRTFTSQRVRIGPRLNLPSASMPAKSIGGGMVALSGNHGRGDLVFVLDEGGIFSRYPGITVSAVSHQPDVRPRAIALPADAVSSPPCVWFTAFFVKGIGRSPRGPVVVTRWLNEGGSFRSVVVDPARHTLRLQPVLRFSTRDVDYLRKHAATFLFSVTATRGARPFFLIGVLRRPNGQYTEARFIPTGEAQGWSAFVHKPGETTEVTFFALDDSPALQSACRPTLKQPPQVLMPSASEPGAAVSGAAPTDIGRPPAVRRK